MKVTLTLNDLIEEIERRLDLPVVDAADIREWKALKACWTILRDLGLPTNNEKEDPMRAALQAVVESYDRSLPFIHGDTRVALQCVIESYGEPFAEDFGIVEAPAIEAARKALGQPPRRRSRARKGL